MTSSEVFFSQTWEDPRVDALAIRIAPGNRVLCITSGGCTPLSLLLDDPGEIVSVDANPAQTYIAELKVAALRRLDPEDLHRFLGVRPGDGRARTYAQLRRELPSECRDYWDAHPADIDGGVVDCGRLDRFMAEVGSVLRRVAYPPAKLDAFFGCRTLDEQREFYRTRVDGGMGRLAGYVLFHILMRPAFLGWFLPPDFFSHVTDTGFGPALRQRLRHVLTELPLATNYFVSRIYRGTFPEVEDGLPPYLQPSRLPVLRQRLERLRFETARLEDALMRLPDASIDRFQLSNVFEWIPEPALRAAFEQIHRVARPGARSFFRNFMVKRQVPAGLEALFDSDAGAAEELRSQDRSFIYSAFYLLTRAEAELALVPAGRQAAVPASLVPESEPMTGLQGLRT